MLAIGLGAAAGGAVVLAIVNPRSLLLSKIDIFVWGVVLAIVAGVVALVDPATLARRTRRRLIEPPSFDPTEEPAAPPSDRSTAYAELWDEEPALPAAEADRWESFVGRAHEASDTAHDDLDQIDRWYGTPPPPRHRHRRPAPPVGQGDG